MSEFTDLTQAERDSLRDWWKEEEGVQYQICKRCYRDPCRCVDAAACRAPEEERNARSR